MQLAIGDEVIGCYAPADAPAPTPEWLAAPAPRAADIVQLDGRVLDHVWQLVAGNAAQIWRDFAVSRVALHEPATLPCDTIGNGAAALRLGRDVTIEPNVVFDFSHGPIWLDDGVTVRAFTRLAGPACIGSRSTLLGGVYDAVSIGPVCRVHGELEESVVLGYSNKAHHGFLGHAYLGRWVNLGALTTNSDLKNNYGSIRMWTPAGDVDTGLIKLGCLLGDHVKTGIGTLINTGTVVGAGSNLFGGAMPPKQVPPFSWGTGSELVAYDIERFLQVTGVVMRRRGVVLSDGVTDVLRAAYRLARPAS
jgi:UDP-N-acetylglucosamine diphosphorylase/glucosamine-1-phosphate N-acetyltransferase